MIPDKKGRKLEVGLKKYRICFCKKKNEGRKWKYSLKNLEWWRKIHIGHVRNLGKKIEKKWRLYSQAATKNKETKKETMNSRRKIKMKNY